MATDMLNTKEILTTDKFNRFFSYISFRLNNFRSARKELDLYLSSEFNVFNFIRPDENRLSDIVADMLNKDGSHGQKDLFLKKLFLICDVDYSIPDCYTVKREEATRYIKYSNRRIDITVKCNNFSIGIENKPRASEQPNQVSDYVEDLRKEHDNYLFLYLSGNGEEPKSIDEKLRDKLKKEKKLITLAYRHELLSWLESCRNECNSDKYRWFLKDLIEYIYNTFSINNNKDGENV